MTRPILLMLGFLLAAPAQAQSIYKYVLPDGRVVYSDKPMQGVKPLEELEPPAPPSDPEAARRRAAEDAAALERTAKPATGQTVTLDEAWEQRQRWARRLEEAQQALEAGREPREGERIGTAGGRARMNDAYWERQRRNEAAVAEAEARARRAQDDINRLR
jgi:hypothetical protein